MYDAKYHHAIWRPVTAIRLGSTIHNPRIKEDPAWTPFAVTAPDPSYPGGTALRAQVTRSPVHAAAPVPAVA